MSAARTSCSALTCSGDIGGESADEYPGFSGDASARPNSAVSRPARAVRNPADIADPPKVPSIVRERSFERLEERSSSPPPASYRADAATPAGGGGAKHGSNAAIDAPPNAPKPDGVCTDAFGGRNAPSPPFFGFRPRPSRLSLAVTIMATSSSSAEGGAHEDDDACCRPENVPSPGPDVFASRGSYPSISSSSTSSTRIDSDPEGEPDPSGVPAADENRAGSPDDATPRGIACDPLP